MDSNTNNRNKSNAIMNIVMIVIAAATVVFVTYKYIKGKDNKPKVSTNVIKKTKWTKEDSIEWEAAVKKAHAESMAQKKANVAGVSEVFAIQMAQRFAKGRMDFPETVAFEGKAKCVAGHGGYVVTQELVERGGDGAYLKFKYRIVLIFTGGDHKDFSRWTYDELSITNEATGREIIFSTPDDWL